MRIVTESLGIREVARKCTNKLPFSIMMKRDSRSPPNCITVTCRTWDHISHGLFDYESQATFEERLELSQSTAIFRGNDRLYAGLYEQLSETGDEPLVRAELTQEGWRLHSGPEQLWHVVRRPEGDKTQFRLVQGDVIKLGRVSFLVRELCPYEEEDKTQLKVDKPRAFGGTCRICLAEEGESPLISPCSCKGTMEFVHLSCLQRWVNSRHVSRTGEHSVSYYWKNVSCELCQMPYKSAVEDFDILKYQRPEAPYIVLQTSSRVGQVSVHVISMLNKANVRLGRGNDSDFRISDTSVSRCHALIRHSQGMFTLEDNHSKFGTLIRAKSPQKFEGLTVLQIGRSVLSFSVKRTPLFKSPDAL